MKKSLAILAVASSFLAHGAFAQETGAAQTIKEYFGVASQAKKTTDGKCPDGAMLTAGYMCVMDKPSTGCPQDKGFYTLKSANPNKCFSCHSNKKWDSGEFACK